MDKITWDLDDGRVVELTYTLSTDFNVNEVVRIDINNLLGEYLTAPVLFNTIANLRTLAMEAVGKKSLQLKIAKREVFLDILKSVKPKPANTVIDAMVEASDLFIESTIELIQAEKNSSMMDNLYWSMKEKCHKLDNLYHKITPEEFNKEIMESQVNNVMIKFKKALIH